MSAAEPSFVAANMPRYEQCEMERLFSRESRYTIWRKLWFWLAESQKELGIVYLVPIPNSKPPAFTEERIDDDGLEQLRHCCYVSSRDVAVPNMRQLSPDHKLDLRAQFHFVTDIDAPRSEHWLNIGVTPEYILENTEQILMRDALDILNTKLSMLLYRLQNFAMDHKSVQCLMYESDLDKTVFVTTIGQRVAGWAKKLAILLEAFQTTRHQYNIDFCGKLSMLEHFEGDQSKCERLDDLIRQKLGFQECRARDYLIYRQSTNALLGFICFYLGSVAVSVVEDLNHFDDGGQLVEKRANCNGTPVTDGDPKFRQSGILKGAAEALMRVSISFRDPGVSKTEGQDEYIMARMFKQAVRVVNVLQSIVEGLYCDPENGHDVKWSEIPYMMIDPLIRRLMLRGEARRDILWHLNNISLSLRDEPQEGRTDRFLKTITNDNFFRRYFYDMKEIVLSLQDVSESERRVDEICGRNGAIDRVLLPYRAYVREKTAGERQSAQPLMIEPA